MRLIDPSCETRPNKQPRRVLHFSDGSLEEYSEDENETSKTCTEVKESPIDPVNNCFSFLNSLLDQPQSLFNSL